jgi:xanthine/uracil permease
MGLKYIYAATFTSSRSTRRCQYWRRSRPRIHRTLVQLSWPRVVAITFDCAHMLRKAGRRLGKSTSGAPVVTDLSGAEERSGFTIFGIVETILPGVLGVQATVAYGENLGIVQLTRVAARAFVVVAAEIFILLAFIGQFGALMAVMPGDARSKSCVN